MKHKSTYQSHLTRERIDAYRNGNTTVRRETEGQISDSFDQDALDGWEESGLSTSAMHSRLDKRFSYSNKGLYLISATAAVLILSAFFLVKYFNKEATPQMQQVELSVEHSDAVMPESIDTLQELPKSEQISIVSIKHNQQDIHTEPETAPVATIDELPKVVLEPLILEVSTPEVRVSTQKNAKEIYLHDLKLIDYSQYRSRPVIPTERIVMTGTPADQEEKTNHEAETTTITKVDIPYMDYIDKTMGFVSNGKWKQSLQRLQIVLETYPDDVNAHFYAGLCFYNLQQYEDAKTHFATCLQLSYSNFNEESSWYLAQSFLANGEKNSAKELLTAIRDQKGYYAKQAEKLLKGIR